MSFLKHFKIVLVRAENPVNIGQVARAMKNFGLSELTLVSCAPHRVPEAYTPGWKARHILTRARKIRSLDQALQGSALTVGFTARKGKRRGEPQPIMELIPQILETARNQKVALVFGNEKNGLSNEELKKCHLVATIPTADDYSSLNLSHAIAIAAFSIFSQTAKARKVFKKPKRFSTTPQEFDALIQDFYDILKWLGYKSTAENDLLDRVTDGLRHYFQKSGLDRRELHLFKAFLARVKQKLKPNPKERKPLLLDV